MLNWKVRFRNPLWWVQVILAIITPIMVYYGVTAPDITTWGLFLDLLGSAISNPYVVFTIVISVWNAVNDPTTAGVYDSIQAMGYKVPKKRESAVNDAEDKKES